MKTLLTSFCLCVMLAISAHADPMSKANLSAPLPANLWIEMSKVTQPGIVGVYLDVGLKRGMVRRDPFFDFLEEHFGEGFEFETPQAQDNAKPVGTGFVVDKDGYILTNYHVIGAIDNPKLNTQLKVQIDGEKKLHEVEVVGRDSRGDLALLKLKTPVKNLHALEFGDSDKLEVGEYVAAFGNPYGHSNSMTVGIISAKGRAIKELNRFPFIQTDASINPGNSGGPLLDSKGYVIAVNTAIDARAQGIGFAIPSNYVKKVIGILKSGGTIERGYLGIELATLNPRYALSVGIKKSGVVAVNVQEGYPAAKAGLKRSDIIVEFNDNPILNTEEFISMVQDTEVGKTVSIKVLRPMEKEFKELDLQVTLANFPDPGVPKNEKSTSRYLGQVIPYNIGFSITDSSSGARRHFDVPVEFPFAPIISRVSSGSLASKAGMEPGHLVMMVNGAGVNNSADVIKTVKKGQNEFLIKTKDGEKTVSISTK